MKAKLFVGALALLLFTVQALSYRALLMWDPNPAEEGITNYIVFVGTSTNTVVWTNWLGEAHTNHVYDLLTNQVGNVTTNILSNMVDGVRYWIAAKAENAFGQSDYSDEISVVKPTGPFMVLNAVVEGSTNVLGPWSDRVVFPKVIFLYPTNEEEILRLKLDWERHTNSTPQSP